MHANEEVVRREAAAWDAGDLEAIVAIYTPEAVIHSPGNNRFSGDYRGHEGVREYHDNVAKTLGSLDELDVREHDVLANDEHVVRLLEVVARKGDRGVAWRHVAVYHVQGGKIDRVWNHHDPQAEVDVFMTHVTNELARAG